MTDLIVIGYPNTSAAETAREKLLGLQKEYLLQISDAVIATRDEKGRVKLNQLVHLWTLGALTGTFWGLLIGLLFLHPLFGLITGVAAGGLTGALTDYGIDDSFMKDVSNILRPGQAALFLMAERATGDRVVEELSSLGGNVLRTNLDTSQENRLRAAFEKASLAVRDVSPTGAA